MARAAERGWAERSCLYIIEKKLDLCPRCFMMFAAYPLDEDLLVQVVMLVL